MLWVPHDYQRRTILHGWANPGAAWWLDMGLGKTVSALTLVDRLIKANKIKSALVVAPKLVATDVWRQERAKWNHLNNLSINLIDGSPVSRTIWRTVGDKKIETRTKADPWAEFLLTQAADVTLINYELLPPLIDWMSMQPVLPWDMVIWDESSKMKSWASMRFKLFKPQRHRFKRHLTLTATPAPQNYLDLWSQFYLLDGGQRLGKFITHYKDAFFEKADYMGFSWKLKSGAGPLIEKRIAPITLSMRADEYLKLPPLIMNKIEVTLPPKVMEEYRKVEKKMFAEFDGIAVNPGTAASKSSKCRQIIAGALYHDKSDEFEIIHDAKIAALKEIVESANGQSVLVGYDFNHDVVRLRQAFADTPWIGRGSKNNSETAARWSAGKISLLFVQPASVAHGLNLQDGGHILVWFTLPWSLESFIQLPGRLRRQGQKHPVIAHYIVAPGTIDMVVWNAVQTKGEGQDRLLGAMRAYRQGVA
jgi:SNF2 family DNA or RNA helicase